MYSTAYNLWTFAWFVHFELPFRLKGTEKFPSNIYSILYGQILCGLYLYIAAILPFGAWVETSAFGTYATVLGIYASLLGTYAAVLGTYASGLSSRSTPYGIYGTGVSGPSMVSIRKLLHSPYIKNSNSIEIPKILITWSRYPKCALFILDIRNFSVLSLVDRKIPWHVWLLDF